MTNKNPRDIIIRPVVSEKSYAALDENVYTFVVAPDANKIEIKNAVEALFSVKVLDVHTQVMRGKEKRIGRYMGMRPNWKKAIVTLKEGDAIQLFEGK